MAFNKIFINLGEGCNFSCKYCLQRGNLEGCLPKDLKPEFLEYLKNFDTKDESIHLTFFGGEPLMYWDIVKYIVEQLAPLNKFNMGIVSNGSLLTRDKVDFINKYHLGYALSHDGHVTKYTRGHDVLADPEIMAMFLSITNRGISAVMTAKNCDYYELWDYFNKRFAPYGGVMVNIDIIYDTCLPDDMVNFDMEKYSRSVDRVCENMIYSTNNGFSNMREYGMLQMYVQKLSNVLAGKVDLSLPKCGTSISMLNADLHGNCYLCHNSTIRMGTVWDSEEAIRERFEKHNRYAPSEKCQSCNVLPLCSGGCILIKPGQAHEAYCAIHKILFNKVYETIAAYN